MCRCIDYSDLEIFNNQNIPKTTSRVYQSLKFPFSNRYPSRLNIPPDFKDDDDDAVFENRYKIN